MNKNISTSAGKIGVLGLGYVGLPLAVEFGKFGDVIGFDISSERIKKLSCGIDETLGGLFSATSFGNWPFLLPSSRKFTRLQHLHCHCPHTRGRIKKTRYVDPYFRFPVGRDSAVSRKHSHL